MPTLPFEAYAIAAPGLAPLVAAELTSLGIAIGDVDAGGVAFRANSKSLYSVNLNSRLASRVLVRVGEFRAANFHELEKRSARIAWDEWIAPGRAVALRVTCRKSRLYHSGAVAERVAGALSQVTQSVAMRESDGEGEEDEPATPNEEPQRILVRLLHDRCTISIDSSGALLHRRGYRRAIARAPLRETLASAMLVGCEWDGSPALLDPFCGSGTIPIEAALIARRIAPGRNRAFGFQQWPSYNATSWREVMERARERERVSAVPIQGSDRDAGAIDAALANAERAGVVGDIEFKKASASSIAPIAPRGLVLTNPPYGVRVGGGGARDLRDLYARLGAVLRRDFGDWKFAMLSPDRRLEGQLGVRLREVLRTRNGGIDVRLVASDRLAAEAR